MVVIKLYPVKPLQMCKLWLWGCWDSAGAVRVKLAQKLASCLWCGAEVRVFRKKPIFKAVPSMAEEYDFDIVWRRGAALFETSKAKLFYATKK